LHADALGRDPAGEFFLGHGGVSSDDAFNGAQ
jgi:hypothetical protein